MIVLITARPQINEGNQSCVCVIPSLPIYINSTSTKIYAPTYRESESDEDSVPTPLQDCF